MNTKIKMQEREIVETRNELFFTEKGIVVAIQARRRGSKVWETEKMMSLIDFQKQNAVHDTHWR